MRTCIFLLMCLVGNIAASADVLAVRRALPQQFDDKSAEAIVVASIRAHTDSSEINQRNLVLEYSNFVNSGKYNILEVTSYYSGLYLVGVDIVFLPFEGIGNRLRLSIQNHLEKSFRQPDYNHHYVIAKYLLEHRTRDVPMVSTVVASKIDVATEILYIKPTWDDPNKPLPRELAQALSALSQLTPP